MTAFVLGVIASFLALGTAFLRLLARSEELSKSRKNLDGGPKKGEALQDVAAWTGMLATTAAVVGVAFIPNADVPAPAVYTVGGVLAAAWLVGMIYIVALWRRFGWPYSSRAGS